MKNIIYAGSSFAKTSFAPEPNAPVTNLQKELGLIAIDVSKCAIGNIEILSRVQEQIVLGKKLNKPVQGIVWVYAEPLVEIELAGELAMKDFLTQAELTNYKAYTELNHTILDLINSIGIPVALIGGHADIDQKIHRGNITVLHPSWQRYLIDSIGYDYVDGWEERTGWGADIVHRWMQLLDVNPSPDLARRISETFFVWSLIEKQNLWWETHPSYEGTQIFASKINSNFFDWIEKI